VGRGSPPTYSTATARSSGNRPSPVSRCNKPCSIACVGRGFVGVTPSNPRLAPWREHAGLGRAIGHTATERRPGSPARRETRHNASTAADLGTRIYFIRLKHGQLHTGPEWGHHGLRRHIPGSGHTDRPDTVHYSVRTTPHVGETVEPDVSARPPRPTGDVPTLRVQTHSTERPGTLGRVLRPYVARWRRRVLPQNGDDGPDDVEYNCFCTPCRRESLSQYIVMVVMAPVVSPPPGCGVSIVRTHRGTRGVRCQFPTVPARGRNDGPSQVRSFRKNRTDSFFHLERPKLPRS
jgi:hypothetical protein